MLDLKPETLQALEADEGPRIQYFVFFDFMFFPLRVHSKEGSVEWDGHKWDGIGKVLYQGTDKSRVMMDHQLMAFSSRPGGSRYTQGYAVASLPLDKTTREVIAKGYYRGRKMVVYMCSYDEQGGIIERFCYLPRNTIVELGAKENVVTFKAIDESFDSVAEKDQRWKRDAEAVRQQFKSDWLETAKSGWFGWLVNMVGTFLGNVSGLVIDVLMAFQASKRRDLSQRWKARKRVYWFTTEPDIPRLWRRKRAYKVRADTLQEAKEIIYREAAAKVWLFPRGCIKLIVYPEGRMPEIFDLDGVRRHFDPERWEATDPARQWMNAVSAMSDANKDG